MNDWQTMNAAHFTKPHLLSYLPSISYSFAEQTTCCSKLTLVLLCLIANIPLHTENTRLAENFVFFFKFSAFHEGRRLLRKRCNKGTNGKRILATFFLARKQGACHKTVHSDRFQQWIMSKLTIKHWREMPALLWQLTARLLLWKSHIWPSTRLNVYCLHGLLPGPFLLSYSVLVFIYLSYLSLFFHFCAVR